LLYDLAELKRAGKYERKAFKKENGYAPHLLSYKYRALAKRIERAYQ
jgi:hypothetical protein